VVRCGGNADLRGLERRRRLRPRGTPFEAVRREGAGSARPRGAGGTPGRGASCGERASTSVEPDPRPGRRRRGSRARTAARVDPPVPSPDPESGSPHAVHLAHISTVSRLVVTKIAPDIPTTFLQKSLQLHTLCMTPLTGPHQRGAERADSVRPLRSEWPHASRAQHGRHSRSSSPSSF